MSSDHLCLGSSDEHRPAAAPERSHSAAASCADCGESSGGRSDPGRYKLWELQPGGHCSIIGTCLDLSDLRRIARKAAVPLRPDLHDYDIHGYFVTRAAERSQLSKLVHKALDRKYAGQIARFRRSASPQELRDLWQQALASGEIAGAYWALMSHKGTPLALQTRAYNEVHMLSHLMGRSSCDSIKRLRELEATCAELSERLAKARARNHERLRARDAALRDADAALRQRDTRIRALEAQLSQSHGGAEGGDESRRTHSEEWDRLRARLATLEQRLKDEGVRARAAEARLRALAATSATEESKRVVPPAQSAMPDAVSLRRADLQGCAVLYVGGRPHLTPRLRAHAQRLNAQLLYHDGGLEAQNDKLSFLVSRSGAVFCPVGCVSHDACLRLKHLCKRQNKPLVLLRSAGLSSFVSALIAMVARHGDMRGEEFANANHSYIDSRIRQP